MPCAAPPFGRSQSLSRRQIISAGASALMLRSPSFAQAQGTPEASPQRPPPGPASGRDTSSWFVLSRPAGSGYITDADGFEVYDGRSFQLLGGFPSVGTRSIRVTTNPAKILLDTLTGPSIFDLETGNVTRVIWKAEEPVGSVRLPDPRWATPTPRPWSFFTNDYRARALLVNLDTGTGIDLADTLAKPGEKSSYPSIRFSPDGRLLAVTVAHHGYLVLEPEDLAGARPLNGGTGDGISWEPEFSSDSSRLVYVLRRPNKSTFVVQDLRNDEDIEVAPVGRNGFAIFPPGRNDELITLTDGTITRREIEGRRTVWRARSEEIVFMTGVAGNALLTGSAALSAGSTPIWQIIDFETGESRPLPRLRGLVSYNGSYANPEPTFQLMGPPSGEYYEDFPGRLAALNLESADEIPLLDETRYWGDAFPYGTSWDNRIVLYTPFRERRYHLFDLGGGETRSFSDGDELMFLFDPSVSADGAAAGFTHWDRSGSGRPDRMEVRLLDVAGGGEPEPFMEGRLWVWAGGPAATAASASQAITPGPATTGTLPAGSGSAILGDTTSPPGSLQEHRPA